MQEKMIHSMLPLMPKLNSGRSAAPSSQAEGKPFSEHMKETIASEEREKKNLLGVSKKEQKQPADAGTKKTAHKDQSSSNEAEQVVTGPPAIPAILTQMMKDLEAMSTDVKLGPGQWTFTDQDFGMLKELAASAGLSEQQLALLKTKFEESGHALNLQDLFADLGSHFQKLGEVKPVEVSDAHLPFLESLLSKLGVPLEEVQNIFDDALTGLDTLDLGMLLEGLNDISLPEGMIKPVELGQWDAEQLWMVLEEAGVPKEILGKILPENFAASADQQFLIHPAMDEKGVPLTISLDQLAAVLEKGLAEATADRPAAKLPDFLYDLKNILQQAGFADKTVGWSPVVQQTVTQMYEGLQRLVDLAEIRIEKVNELMAENELLIKEWLDSSDKGMQWSGTKESLQNLLNQTGVETAGGLSGEDESDSEIFDALGAVADNTPASGDESGEMPLGIHQDDQDPLGDLAALRNQLQRSRMAPSHAQMVLDQISQGVFRGIKNNQHHLTISMYPKELGEVKVDMQVRDNQVSVSFIMENPKVKQMLESSMEQFRENMEQQGFTLQEFSVFVGQQQNDDSLRERFELAWENVNQTKPAQRLEPSESLLYQVVDEQYWQRRSANNVNLIV